MKITVTVSGAAKALTHCGRMGKRVVLEKYRNGLSAYELAVKNGYTGTEQEFVSGMIEEDSDFLAHYILSKN